MAESAEQQAWYCKKCRYIHSARVTYLGNPICDGEEGNREEYLLTLGWTPEKLVQLESARCGGLHIVESSSRREP